MDPTKRLSASEALNDPWVQSNAPQLAMSKKALSSLTQFQSKNKMKQAVMTFIVSQLIGREEKEELAKTFR